MSGKSKKGFFSNDPTVISSDQAYLCQEKGGDVEEKKSKIIAKFE